MENKIKKIDSFFIIGIIIIAILGSSIDFFCWKDVEYGGFPVFTLMSIYFSYALLMILLIYSYILKRKMNNASYQKPKLIRWYSFLLIPLYHIAIMLITFILLNILNSFLKI